MDPRFNRIDHREGIGDENYESGCSVSFLKTDDCPGMRFELAAMFSSMKLSSD